MDCMRSAWMLAALLASALVIASAQDPVTCTSGGNECDALAPATCLDGYSCDAVQSVCTPNYTPSGTSCTSSNGAAGTCDGAGTCQVPVDLCKDVMCDTPPTCKAAGTCNPATGTCSDPTPLPEGEVCTDANGNESTCDGAGSCTVKDLCKDVLCPTPATCFAIGTCNSATGTCSDATPLPKGEGTCTDVNNNESTCDGTGACQTRDLCAENNVVCEDPTNVCLAAGVCQPATGVCTYAPKENGEVCLKNGVEGKCNGAADPVCDLCADGCDANPNVCMDAGTCNPDNGDCTYAPLPRGSTCLKNDLEGQCDGQADPKCDLCAGVVCEPDGYGEGCVREKCNPETKLCDRSFKNLDSGCNKGKGRCKADGVCDPRPPPPKGRGMRLF